MKYDDITGVTLPHPSYVQDQQQPSRTDLEVNPREFYNLTVRGKNAAVDLQEGKT